MTFATALLLTILPPTAQAQGAEALMPPTDKRHALVKPGEVKRLRKAMPKPEPEPDPEPVVVVRQEPATPPGGILNCIAHYESHGNYAAVNPAGYYGKYQFDQSTWDGVASRHNPDYVGVRPDQAPPGVQDQLALALYNERGLQPWPTPARYCA